MKNKKLLRLATLCPAGTENLVAKEIETFAGAVYEIRPGFVGWNATLEAAYRACLWSRFASKVLMQIAHFNAKNEDHLYQEINHIDWEKHLDLSSTFAVDCTLAAKAAINHSKFAALRVKDAIADHFKKKYGKRPSVKVQRPDLQLNIHIDGRNKASLFVDLSGESLHKRGYRQDSVMAPLKENLAAAIVAYAEWPQTDREGFIDPMCGSGTLLIEAALAFGDSAPGLSRNYFGLLGWKQHDNQLWSKLIDEAIKREDEGLQKSWPIMLGYDADPKAVAVARKNIKRAGLEEKIKVNQSALFAIQKPAEKGILLCNPPYGKRLEEKQEVAQLYKAMGRLFNSRLSGWNVGIFVSNPELTDNIGIVWKKKYNLANGSINCKLLIGETVPVFQDNSGFSWKISHQEVSEARELANRLRKNAKVIFKWAAKENITNFRIYDADIPEFNFSVDMYEKWIHVQEYAAPKSIDMDVSKKRFNLGLAVIRRVFGVNRERIFIKTKSRQRGSKQYQKKGNQQKMYTVYEGGCSFLVNFTDYLDTGLFLDHRPTRMKIAALSRGKRFLNLFAYTGTATVHACLGGAVSTTTVDLSSRYLDWAKMNMALNGISGPFHQLVKADCMQWLSEHDGKYDLIFIDPPTFSNTKKEKRVFDIQRHHADLVKRAMKLLEKNGLLIFSTNFRRFCMDENLIKEFDVNDVTMQTIPFDFKRDRHIHKCWEIQHKKKG